MHTERQATLWLFHKVQVRPVMRRALVRFIVLFDLNLVYGGADLSIIEQ
jgi:hypothetical protein